VPQGPVAAKLAEIYTVFPAQFLHSEKIAISSVIKPMGCESYITLSGWRLVQKTKLTLAMGFQGNSATHRILEMIEPQHKSFLHFFIALPASPDLLTQHSEARNNGRAGHPQHLRALIFTPRSSEEHYERL
jgi:hypothetical protein